MDFLIVVLISLGAMCVFDLGVVLFLMWKSKDGEDENNDVTYYEYVKNEDDEDEIQMY